MTKVFVLSGTFQQAINYAQLHSVNPNNLVYVDRPEKLRGHRGGTLYKTGTYYMRDDYHEIEDYALACGFKIVEVVL